jgi:hypothetical protein
MLPRFGELWQPVDCCRAALGHSDYRLVSPATADEIGGGNYLLQEAEFAAQPMVAPGCRRLPKVEGEERSAGLVG